MAPARSRILAQIVLAVNALCSPLLTQVAAAQDQPPAEAPSRAIDYDVRIDAPRQLRDLLENNLDLMRWRGNPRLDMEQLLRLVRTTPEQIKTLVATEGYYTPKVSADLDTSGSKPLALVDVVPGDPVIVGDVDIELRGFVPFDKGSAPIDAAALRRTGKRPSAASCARWRNRASRAHSCSIRPPPSTRIRTAPC
jgi:translocation and assembly module TamA